MMLPIKKYCDNLIKDFNEIQNERKEILQKVTHYIEQNKGLNSHVNLIYICTHNSRRSHFGQIWSQVAANYYNIKKVKSFSGGTEETAFNINAINTLRRIGFDIEPINVEKNLIYHLFYDNIEIPIVCFSKVYNHVENPQKEFAAIMTCSDADENCPFILGAELRIATTYNDPKEFDNTPLQDIEYEKCCRQIALETFYAFSLINQ